MMADESIAQPILLSATRASADQRRAALFVGLTVLIACLATLPFATIPGPPIPGFVLIQQAWMAITDLITAALLFGQFWVQPAGRLNVLAGGYLFTALTTVLYALSFPGGLSERGLLITGPLSTPWIFLAWYAALPLVLIAYGLSPGTGKKYYRRDSRIGILVAVFTAVGAVVALTTLVIAGYDLLPAVWAGNGYTTEVRVAIDTAMGLALLAFLVLVRRRPYSVLDTWLMVVAFTWLSALVIGGGVIGTQRYDIGNDISRALYMLASTFVLLVLLSQTLALHVRVIRDRERRLNEMETILVHLSRVNELGQHVSTVIHEIGQPLAAISMLAAASIRLADGSTERLRQSLEALAEAAAEAKEIVRHLRGFITSNKPDRSVHRVAELIEDAIRLASFGDLSALTIETEYHPAAATAFCDRVQIEQVVFNLVRNAIEATAGDSRALILTIATGLTPDGLIKISIADNGPGLPSVVRAKLFEPFVTTKASGLGVGLSICRLIVEAHGGQLRADDNPRGGTVFRFTLPRGPTDTVEDLPISIAQSSEN